MGTTPNYDLPYPEESDSPDGATQMKLLAQAIDTALATIVSQLQSGIDLATPLFAFKTEDTKRSNTTTLDDDPDLSIVIEANTRYQFISVLDYEGAAAGSGDLKYQWVPPTGGGLLYSPLFKDTGGNVITGIAGFANEPFIAETGGAANSRSLIGTGMVYNGPNAGNFSLQWAQGTANGSVPTIVHPNSYVALIKMPSSAG